ncbi:hypothetical protein [Bacillus sp. Marseille-Q3570]|uniref:hypothetical protein n=1 Tax=Bacillus sp. Marseille-Q3570 TaxID=2963522 RepID=UPI0021B7AAD2|nr:hypothetical protein [Bacillus sp. Marseille-Q3570]
MRSYLMLLEEESMIRKVSDTKKTTIIICNYNDYQEGKTSNKPKSDFNSDTTNNEKNDQIKFIYDYWNFKNIIVHRSMTTKMNSCLKKALMEYTTDDLTKAIDNYKVILENAAYFFDYKWTLQDFMKPNNFIRFMDEAEPFYSFKKQQYQNEKINWEAFETNE